MYLIIRNSKIIAECKTMGQVISWHKEFKKDDCYVVKGHSIKEFIKRAT